MSEGSRSVEHVPLHVFANVSGVGRQELVGNEVLERSKSVRHSLGSTCHQLLVGGCWYRVLISVLDPTRSTLLLNRVVTGVPITPSVALQGMSYFHFAIPAQN